MEVIQWTSRQKKIASRDCCYISAVHESENYWGFLVNFLGNMNFVEILWRLFIELFLNHEEWSISDIKFRLHSHDATHTWLFISFRSSVMIRFWTFDYDNRKCGKTFWKLKPSPFFLWRWLSTAFYYLNNLRISLLTAIQI